MKREKRMRFIGVAIVALVEVVLARLSVRGLWILSLHFG
jgi:hypothetical protein